jgi:hypothetical protein
MHPAIHSHLLFPCPAVSKGRDNAKFNKKLAELGQIPGVQGSRVMDITKTLTGIV